ncbi:MAG TPA: hypothetical protein VE965_03470, partial [Gammaproteobacteria bacterium]|nr:hypothetical protein [Gammaproteobacteria bacterium]
MARDYRPDEERSLSRLFFILSVILVLASMYVVVDETFVRRPWKRFQTAFYELEYNKLRREVEAKEPALQAAAQEITAKRRQIEAALASNAEYQKAREELERVKARLADVSQAQQFAKSRLDAEYYLYKKAEHEADPEDTKTYKARVDDLEHQVAQLEAPVAELTARRKSLQDEIQGAEAPL